MVYDWDTHKETCFQLYVEEKRTLPEIVDYLRNHNDFTPSPRTLQARFRRWNFPTKQSPAYKDEELVQRVRELWEKNVVQKEMLRTLQDEGFDISMRELMRIRGKNRWLLRGPAEGIHDSTGMQHPRQSGPEVHPLPDEGALTQRQRELAVESAEKWAARKRRRRTRGWAGLPADPPGPPRFPSETTLQESREILELDEERYRELRQRFERICAEAGVVKKTAAGPERWAAAKEQLVRETEHLRSLLEQQEDEGGEGGRGGRARLAVDVICCDVTKRMRMVGRRMGLAEARNVLGLNPQEAREMRSALHRILAADGFEGKLVSGEQRWSELRERWITESERLREMLAAGDATGHVKRAVDALARDASKRYWDDVVRGKKRLEKFPSGTEPEGPVLDHDGNVRFASPVESPIPRSPPQQLAQPPAQQPGQPPVQQPSAQHVPQHHPGISLSHQAPRSWQPPPIDTALESAAYMGHQLAQYTAVQPAQVYHPQQRHAPPPQPQQPSAPAGNTAAPLAVYFRLHPASAVPAGPALWIATLGTRSVEELRGAAAEKFAGAVCLGIEGVVRDGKGGELPLPIHGDAELEAYLAHVHEAQGAPTFSVHLVRGWHR